MVLSSFNPVKIHDGFHPTFAFLMNHEAYMRRCLELAQLGTGWVAPNPLVGCVIVEDQKIIGEGYHACYGEGHAEVNAVNSVRDKDLIKEATVYVSLEPCAHEGKTPPCADLLVTHGVKKVVIATLDPHDKVAGKGVQILREAGIDVSVGMLEQEAKWVARRFFNFHQKKRPYISLKWAETANGFLDETRTSNQQKPLCISCPESNVYGHGLRASEQAILIGTDTAILDNPKLTVRNSAGQNPIRVVLDRTLRLPSDLNVLNDGGRTIVLNDSKTEDLGAIRYIQPEQWSLNSILYKLHKLQIQSVLVEGGSKLLHSFISENIWDEAHVIRSTKVVASSGPNSPLIRGQIINELNSGSDKITVFQNLSESE